MPCMYVKTPFKDTNQKSNFSVPLQHTYKLYEPKISIAHFTTRHLAEE